MEVAVPSFHAALLVGILLAAPAGAAPGDKFDVLRDLASRVGAVVGSALTCKDIARPRVQVVVDKFTAVIREAPTNEAERTDLTQTLDRGITEGRTAVAVGRTDCKLADRQLADLERSIAGPSLSAVIGPAPANAAPAPAPTPTVAPPPPRRDRSRRRHARTGTRRHLPAPRRSRHDRS